MPWYAAHIVQSARFLDGDQNTYPCYEMIVLIEAECGDRAYEAANTIGRSRYGSEFGSAVTWQSRPVEWSYTGIRKITECAGASADLSGTDGDEFRPVNGTEVTFIKMELESQGELDALANGQPVKVLYAE